MFPYFILGIAILAGLLLAGRWYSSADTKTLLKVLKWVLIGLVVTVALFFVVTGRLAWAFFALPALLPWFFRARAAARFAKNFSRMADAATGGSSGRTSDVETGYLKMSLNHDNGDISGEVLQGPFAGRRVEDLTAAELIELLRACWTDDAESARLIEAYLDRNHPEWREAGTGNEKAAGGGSGGMPGAMDRAEALRVLGLDDGADADAVKAAHKRLISGLHPDHGGSDYLAAKINEAKDVLLGK